MGLRTYNIKAIGPSGNIIWQGVVDKVDNNGQRIGLNQKIIDRDIKEVIGYSGKYKLEVK